MDNSAKMYRLVLWSILLFSSTAVAGGNLIDDVSNEFSSIYYKLSKLASPSVSSMSVDSAKMLLAEVQKRIKGVHTILRINSSGTVINEISPAGTAMPMRSVAEQKWFVYVKENNRAYFGTSRESGSNNPLLFWAWPVQTSSGVFGGVLSVKLDAGPVCSEICKSDSIHFAAFYNESLLFRCGNDRYTFTKEANLTLPDSSRIILRAGTAATVSQARNSRNEAVDVESTTGSESFYSDAGAVVGETAKRMVKVEGKEKIEEKKEAVKDVKNQTAKKEKKGLSVLIYIVLFGMIISGSLLVKAIIGKSTASPPGQDQKTVRTSENPYCSDTTEVSETPENPDVHDNSTNSQSQPAITTETITDEKDKNTEGLHGKKVCDETEHHLARETCEKIKAIISENTPSGKISAPSASSTEDALRKELYKEIHGQIMHWVTYESSRLSLSLQELSDRVGKLENVNDPEVMRIRNEAHRISKEIASFKDNTAGQVSSDGTMV